MVGGLYKVVERNFYKVFFLVYIAINEVKGGKKMQKLNDILLLAVGLVFGLPLVGVDQLGVIGDWIVALAFIVIGVKGLMNK